MRGGRSWDFSQFASIVARLCGSPAAAFIAVAVVLAWAVSGPFFGFSEEWQIVINTGTTIVTFLMVFVIQSSQNRDGLALQLKLDELIHAVSHARNSMIGLEDRSEKELRRLHESFEGQAAQVTGTHHHAAPRTPGQNLSSTRKRQGKTAKGKLSERQRKPRK